MADTQFSIESLAEMMLHRAQSMPLPFEANATPDSTIGDGREWPLVAWDRRAQYFRVIVWDSGQQWHEGLDWAAAQTLLEEVLPHAGHP